MVKIQLALDFLKFEEAFEVAKNTEKYVDWIEAGTPLIKSEGIVVIKKLKKYFPNKKIVADLKTMDTGTLEAQMAIDAGADLVTVLGVADDKTIKDAIATAHKNKKECIVDLINSDEKRWKEIEKLEPDYLLIHAGIDQQSKGIDPLKQLKKLKSKNKIAIAGGINKEKIKELTGRNIEVIIVGGAITRAENPKKSAKEIREELDKYFKET